VRSAGHLLLAALIVAGVWSVGPVGAVESVGGRLWAVLIGIDIYDRQEVPPLRCAVADATLLRDTLKSLKVPDERLFLLTSDRTGDSKATKSNIVFRLTQLRNQVKPGDTVVFFFAGHGMELEEGASYLLPAEADARTAETLEDSALESARVTGLLKKLPASRLLMLVDACRNDPRGGRAAADNLLGQGTTRDLQLDEAATSVGSSSRVSATLLACSPGERAFEWSDQGHGFFTWHLVEGLKGNAADESGVVTLPRLVSYVEKTVPSSSQTVTGRTQTPWHHSQGTGLEGWALVQVRPSSPEVPLASSPGRPPAASPPQIILQSPSGDATVEGDRLTLLGTVQGAVDLVSVSVNGRPVQGGVQKTGAGALLDAAVPLEPGRNTIAVRAVGTTGLPALASVVVTRTRPAPAANSSVAPQSAIRPSSPSAVHPPPSEPPAPSSPVAGMVFVQAGEFTMGSTDRPDQMPARNVFVAAFHIDECEVTNAEYQAFVQATGYSVEGRWAPPTSPVLGGRPAVNVTYADAEAYARWAGKRLPTEEEWEKAARGFRGYRFPWGDQYLRNHAVLRDLGLSEPAAPRSYPDGKSPYGAMDMLGNVWEWTSSEYRAYPGSTMTDPNFGRGAKVIRGGSYQSMGDVTASTRSFRLPALGSKDLGFRCVR